MTAPPHAHAQSFAKAILTDITASLFLTFGRMDEGSRRYSFAAVAVASRCKRSV
jgi:hypothetical protein